ncbi:toxin-antitoxin system HicB family antitoxin [Streptomyces sp. UNOB3_S3]|uniref:toxin-antitoxin system HicB family antitoxin n=1 Tax=Streptomyces sp. UNOB3_S3 TaxID=2871682 RepID=UPI001E625420|nr:toxin-antitoxin system HicB family antitoxin [Streptomyces sp. UNOB3_S3]MCC3779376.1 toxin-antitoxin system HicB family antitoxin [Streptomyces sp. UNOB3_S3]
MSPQADLQSRAEELFQLPWSREVLADEDGGYLARVPELPGCFADGDTVEEALANLNLILREWLTISLERGDSVPQPRRVNDSFSGRFSVRVPRSVHEALSRRAEEENCSLNQLVTVLLTEGVRQPRTLATAASTDSDISESIAADAVRSGNQAIAALKGIGTVLRDRGQPNLACVVYAMAANIVADVEHAEAAAREFGMAASLARREKHHKLAEALLRESVHRDPTNLRSSSSLGQLLYFQGRYNEAAAYLSRVASIDNYAKLFLGWSRLLEGMNLSDEAQQKAGLNDLVAALREWSYQKGNRGSKSSWLRQVQRLARLGSGCLEEARHLIQFANTNANWGTIDPAVLTAPASEGDTTPSLDDLQSMPLEQRLTE